MSSSTTGEAAIAAASQPGKPDAADERPLVFDPEHPPGLGGAHARLDGADELPVRGLRPDSADPAERRAAMAGERLEVEHLLAFLLELGEELGLARPGQAARRRRAMPPEMIDATDSKIQTNRLHRTSRGDCLGSENFFLTRLKSGLSEASPTVTTAA